MTRYTQLDVDQAIALCSAVACGTAWSNAQRALGLLEGSRAMDLAWSAWDACWVRLVDGRRVTHLDLCISEHCGAEAHALLESGWLPVKELS